MSKMCTCARSQTVRLNIDCMCSDAGASTRVCRGECGSAGVSVRHWGALVVRLAPACDARREGAVGSKRRRSRRRGPKLALCLREPHGYGNVLARRTHGAAARRRGTCTRVPERLRPASPRPASPRPPRAIRAHRALTSPTFGTALEQVLVPHGVTAAAQGIAGCRETAPSQPPM